MAKRRRLFKVDVDVEARTDGSRQTMRFDVLAETEAEARGKATKIAKRMGDGLVRGGLFVRPAAAARGGDAT